MLEDSLDCSLVTARFDLPRAWFTVHRTPPRAGRVHARAQAAAARPKP
ncbi:hypothetical protein DB30_03336 [Enhygromyxa salina]|uniref:Uncharacterized protein n=1 Tax=Enhygromyxa salina TaxID=215803 RepID=A0A0C2DCH7_9BACT|nr:hypothetical protein DB30_03336 [Enhygromyxa salina]